jgi:hypothetical protein
MLPANLYGRIVVVVGGNKSKRLFVPTIILVAQRHIPFIHAGDVWE